MSGKIPRPTGAIAPVSVLLAFGVGVCAHGAAAHGAECLAAPNAVVQPGTHWYYRLDRVQHRKCWHVRAASPQSRRTPAETTAVVPETVPAQTTPATGQPAAIRPKGMTLPQGGGNMSQKEREELYAQFLEWVRRSN